MEPTVSVYLWLGVIVLKGEVSNECEPAICQYFGGGESPIAWVAEADRRGRVA